MSERCAHCGHLTDTFGRHYNNGGDEGCRIIRLITENVGLRAENERLRGELAREMSAHEATTHDYTDVTGQLADLGFQHAQMVAENERLRADLFASLREWDLVEENELRGLRTGKIEELRKAYGVPLTTWCKLCREKGCSACGGTGRLECTANQDAIRAWLALREKE